ncbi:hypothetical protein VTN00DRAFT_5226 [Thermoascus crustaceus]|uniref:uncharacterized protein n=1 Tax=Thermoascus crustaceus TaxID=5088 RepID=UPI003743DE96
MSKRSVFTTVTPLPHYITRETVVETLHNHSEMIELNPLVIHHARCKPPPVAPPDEFHCIWYELTDKISYLPGGVLTGNVNYKACFYDLPRGLQTHVYASAGLDIRDKWSVCGNMPGEPREPVELGLVDAPREGLYLREDVDMRCNIVMTNFVKKTLKRAHAVLVERLIMKADILKERAERSNSTLQREGSLRAFSTYSAYSTNSHPQPIFSATSSEFGGGSDPRLQHPASLTPGEDPSTRRSSGSHGPPNSVKMVNIPEVPGSPPPGYQLDPSVGSRPVWQSPTLRISEVPTGYKHPELVPEPLKRNQIDPRQGIHEME